MAPLHYAAKFTIWQPWVESLREISLLSSSRARYESQAPQIRKMRLSEPAIAALTLSAVNLSLLIRATYFACYEKVINRSVHIKI